MNAGAFEQLNARTLGRLDASPLGAVEALGSGGGQWRWAAGVGSGGWAVEVGSGGWDSRGRVEDGLRPDLRPDLT